MPRRDARSQDGTQTVAPGESATRDAAAHTESVVLEARAAAAVNHPHVVAIYAVGECDGTPYVTMEYLDGPASASAVLRIMSLRG